MHKGELEQCASKNVSIALATVAHSFNTVPIRGTKTKQCGCRKLPYVQSALQDLKDITTVSKISPTTCKKGISGEAHALEHIQQNDLPFRSKTFHLS